MPNYRRLQMPGSTWFFTVNLLQRHNNNLLIEEITTLKACIKKVHRARPFEIIAWVVLPDHMHCLWRLPEGDTDYAIRWRLIKTYFSKAIPPQEYRSAIRIKNGERGIWQRHYWEHWIRDEYDFKQHFDYIHRNPVKHKLVNRVVDWPYSTFHKYVKAGIYPANWCGDSSVKIEVGEIT